jgi:hypothetical protein
VAQSAAVHVSLLAHSDRRQCSVMSEAGGSGNASLRRDFAFWPGPDSTAATALARITSVRIFTILREVANG